MSSVEHNLSIGYTNADDGIWLHCSCTWSECLEFFPSPETVMAAAESHRKNPKKPPRRHWLDERRR